MAERQVPDFLRGWIATIGVRLLDLPSRYGFHLLISAKLGVIQAGGFYIVFSAMMVLAGFGRFSIDRALTRELAVALAAGRQGDARRIMRRGLWQVGLLSSLVIALMLVGAAPFATYVLRKPDLAVPLMLGSLTLLPQNVGSAIAGSLAGLHRVGLSQMIYSWLAPALFCLTALDLTLTVEKALLLNAAAYGVTALIGMALLVKSVPSAARTTGPMPPLLSQGVSLFTLELYQLCLSGAPAIILGITADDRQVGLFALAWRVSLLSNVLISSIAALVAPRFAKFHAQEDREALARTASQAVGLGFGLTIVPVLVMLTFPTFLLNLVGEGFGAGENTLRILALGQLFAALFTGMPELLGMTGHLAQLRRVNLMSLAALLAGCALLSPWLASEGAALATIVAILLNGGAAAQAARRALGIMPWKRLLHARGALFCILAAAALALPPASAKASADRPPRLDIDGLCARSATSLEGFSSDVLLRCMSVEEEAQTALRRLWLETPDYIKDDCIQRNHDNHSDSYVVLQTCIRAQMARQTPPEKAAPKKPKP